MRFARALAGTAMLATLFLLSSDGVQSQDKKEKAPPGKVTGQLPPGWKDLNLSAVQREEVYKINAEAKDKVDKLEEEIKKVKADQVKKRLAVLNEEQRKKLRESVGGEEPKKP